MASVPATRAAGYSRAGSKRPWAMSWLAPSLAAGSPSSWQAMPMARAASSGIMPTEAWACARPFSKRAMAASMAVSENRESIEAGAKMRSNMG